MGWFGRSKWNDGVQQWGWSDGISSRVGRSLALFCDILSKKCTLLNLRYDSPTFVVNVIKYHSQFYFLRLLSAHSFSRPLSHFHLSCHILLLRILLGHMSIIAEPGKNLQMWCTKFNWSSNFIISTPISELTVFSRVQKTSFIHIKIVN